MEKKKAKVRGKSYTIAWLIFHGFIPKESFWVKKMKLLKTSHNFFDYGKFKLCGKYVSAERCNNKETWTVNGIWDFPKGLLKFNIKTIGSHKRDTWVPIERVKDIVCNYMKCMGGMGLVGNGHCYLAGYPYIENCSKFQDHDKIMSKYEQNKNK